MDESTCRSDSRASKGTSGAISCQGSDAAPSSRRRSLVRAFGKPKGSYQPGNFPQQTCTTTTTPTTPPPPPLETTSIVVWLSHDTPVREALPLQLRASLLNLLHPLTAAYLTPTRSPPPPRSQRWQRDGPSPNCPTEQK